MTSLFFCDQFFFATMHMKMVMLFMDDPLEEKLVLFVLIPLAKNYVILKIVCLFLFFLEKIMWYWNLFYLLSFFLYTLQICTVELQWFTVPCTYKYLPYTVQWRNVDGTIIHWISSLQLFHCIAAIQFKKYSGITVILIKAVYCTLHTCFHVSHICSAECRDAQDHLVQFSIPFFDVIFLWIYPRSNIAAK